MKTQQTDRSLEHIQGTRDEIALALHNDAVTRKPTPAQASHSLLPWHVAADDGEGNFAILAQGKDTGRATSAGAITLHDHVAIVEGKANAAFIVLACNEYESLKERLDGSADWQQAAIGLKSALDLSKGKLVEAKAHAQRLADALKRIVKDWEKVDENVQVPDCINVDEHWDEAREALAQWEGLK